MRPGGPAAAAFALLGLAGCGGITPAVSLPCADPSLAVAPEAGPPPTPPPRALDLAALTEGQPERDQRVADVFFRLSRANADLCPDKAAVSGLTLHTLDEYGPEARALIRPVFAAPGPAVLVVAAGSPAAQAGLQRNDVLISIDGEAFPQQEPSGPARYDATARASAQLAAALSAGRPARLEIDRAGRDLSLTLVPQAGCAYQAQVVAADYPGAWADGKTVSITDEMVDYVASDNDLAVVLGHEFAHDLLHHRAKIDDANPARSLIGASPAAMRRAEREADYVGIYLAARAGYDVSSAPAFWARFGKDFPTTPLSLLTHPGAAERTAAMQAAYNEILAKRAAGAPLTPNPAAAAAYGPLEPPAGGAANCGLSAAS